MTPDQLDAIRQSAAEDDPRGGLQARIDRRALLAYVDALEERLAYMIDGYDRVVRIDAHLLAHQQARGIEAREEEAHGIKDYLDLRDHADAQSVRAQSAEAERDTLRAELARKDAEIERLRAQVKALAEDLAGIVYNHDEHGHVDASWFDSARAQLAALGDEREGRS